MEDKPIGFYIKSINNILDKRFNDLLTKYDITKTQADIVMFILCENRKNKIVTQRDIEKTFSLSNPTITGILNRLEEKNYIKREKSMKDSRSKNIIITEKFKNIENDLLNTINKKREALLNEMTKEEIETSIRLLNKIYSNLLKEEL